MILTLPKEVKFALCNSPFPEGRVGTEPPDTLSAKQGGNGYPFYSLWCAELPIKPTTY